MEIASFEIGGHSALVWRTAPGWQTVSSAVLGGGIGPCSWVLNAEVDLSYSRLDPEQHLQKLVCEAGLTGPGVGMLTAASVMRFTRAEDGGVEVVATTGLSKPTWAAAAAEAIQPVSAPGTINLIASVPVRLSHAALVNAVITVTESKAQAMIAAGMPGTGTASDAVCIACPATGSPEPFAGPRSRWGAPLARATYQTVRCGALRWISDHPHLADRVDPPHSPSGDGRAGREASLSEADSDGCEYGKQ